MEATTANFVFGILTVLIGVGLLSRKSTAMQVVGAILAGIGMFGIFVGFGVSLTVAIVAFGVATFATALGRAGIGGAGIALLAVAVLILAALVLSWLPNLNFIGQYFSWLWSNFSTIAQDILRHLNT